MRWNLLSIYCSRECYLNERRDGIKQKTRRIKSIIKKCVICGIEYNPFSRAKGGTCSKACYLKEMELNRAQKPKKICQTCGNEFVPWNGPNGSRGKRIRPPSVYCSHKCAARGITALRPGLQKEWKKRRASGKTNHLDNLWRFAVYKRAGDACEYCGSTGRLNAHHIFSRSGFSTRWDIENGVCLCVSHHMFGNISFHKSPAEMIEWIKEKRGVEWYDELLRRYKTPMNPDDAKEKYREILEGGQYDKITKKYLEE